MMGPDGLKGLPIKASEALQIAQDHVEAQRMVRVWRMKEIYDAIRAQCRVGMTKLSCHDVRESEIAEIMSNGYTVFKGNFTLCEIFWEDAENA